MSDAFGLLKQALGRVGGEEPVRADQVRDAMNEMREPETAPVEARSFPRLLRQAHDAEIIDLSKDENGRYAVRLSNRYGFFAALRMTKNNFCTVQRE